MGPDPPRKITKYRVLSNTGPDPLKIHKDTKVRKRTKIRNRYNQAPHLTQDTNGNVTTSQLDITNKSQEVSPFPAGDHKASINRRAWRQNQASIQCFRCWVNNGPLIVVFGSYLPSSTKKDGPPPPLWQNFGFVMPWLKCFFICSTDEPTMASCPSKLYHADGHTNDLLLGRSSTHTVLYTTCKAEAKVMDIVEGK